MPGPARLTADQYVTVMVRDVNEACVTSNYARSIAENSPVGAPLGAPLVARDPDVLAVDASWRSLRYAMDTNPRNLFAVNLTTGQLTVARNALNDEDPEGNAVEAIIRVYDLGVPSLSCISRVAVQITDVVRCWSRSESWQLGCGAAAALLCDCSRLFFDQLPLSCLSLFCWYCPAHLHAHSTCAHAIIALRISHLQNEPPVVTAGQARSTREATSRPDNPLMQNTFFGGAVEAADPDEGQSALLTYSIAATWPPSARGFVDIVTQGASGGRLFVSAVGAGYKFDFEALPVFSVLVNVTDPAGLWSTGNVTITLQDVNEQPLLEPNATRWVYENASAGAIIGAALSGGAAGAAIRATDPEGSVLTYSIVSGDATGLFDIGILDGSLRVRAGNSLNFEAAGGQMYTLQVQVEDSGQPGNGAKLRDTAPVIIRIGDSNDAPTIGPQGFLLSENAAALTFVGACRAADEDAGDALSFRIVQQDLTLRGEEPFTIVSGTGDIRVAAINGTAAPALNFEAKRRYLLTVEVSDRAGSTASAVMTVDLRDMPDTPRFSKHSFDFSVAKNARTGLVFGSLAATDEDAGDVIVFTIDAAASNGTALFTVDPASGAVSVARVGTSFLPMTDPFILYAVATDATGLSDRALVRVIVIESNGEQRNHQFTVAGAALLPLDCIMPQLSAPASDGRVTRQARQTRPSAPFLLSSPMALISLACRSAHSTCRLRARCAGELARQSNRGRGRAVYRHGCCTDHPLRHCGRQCGRHVWRRSPVGAVVRECPSDVSFPGLASIDAQVRKALGPAEMSIHL